MEQETPEGAFGTTLGSLIRDLIRRQFYDFIREKDGQVSSDILIAEWEAFRHVLNENRAKGIFLEILYYHQRNEELARLKEKGELVSEIFPVTETPRGSYDFVELRRKAEKNLNRVIQVKSRMPKNTSNLQHKASILHRDFRLRLALAVPKNVGKLPTKFDDWKITPIKPQKSRKKKTGRKPTRTRRNAV